MEVHFDKIQKLAKIQKITINDLCININATRTTFWRWSKGLSFPSEDEVRKIAKILNVLPSDISNLKNYNEQSNENLSPTAELWVDIASTSTNKYKESLGYIISNLHTVYNSYSHLMVLANGLINTSNVLFYTKDINNQYIIANTSFLETLGLNSAFVTLGKKDEDLFNKKEAEINSEQDKEILSTGKSLENFEQIIPGTKSRRWGLFSKTPIYNDDNKIIGLITFINDITLRKKDELIKNILQQSINSVDICVQIWSVDKRKMIFANDSFEKIFDFEIENTLNWTIEQQLSLVVHPDDQKFFEMILKSNNNGNIEYRIVKPSNKEIRYLRTEYGFTKYTDKNCLVFITQDITEKKNLHLQMETLKYNIDQMNIGIAIRDIDTYELLYINNALHNILNQDTSDQKDIEGVLNAAKKIIDPYYFKEVSAFMRSDKPFNTIFKSININKENRWILLERSYIKIGGKTYWLYTTKDITELKENEEIRRTLEQSINYSDFCIRLKEVNTENYLFASENYKDIFGITSDEVIKMSAQKARELAFINKEQIKEYERVYEAVQKKKQEKGEIEYQIKRFDNGKELWIKSYFSYFEYYGKECLLLMSKDITEQKAQEHKKDVLRHFLDNSPDNVYWLSDKNSENIFYVSKSVEKIYGIKINGAFPRKRWLEYIHEDSKQIELDYWAKGNWPQKREYKIKAEDGTVRWIEANIHEAEINNKNYYFSIDTDITEKKSALTELNNAYKALNNLKGTAVLLLKIVESAVMEYVFVSNNVEEVTSYSKEFFLKNKQPEFKIISEEHTSLFKGVFRKQKGYFEIEHQIIQKNGAIKWYETSVNVYQGENGEWYAAIIVSDKEERKMLLQEINSYFEVDKKNEIEQKTLEIASKLKQKGVSVDDISECTGLSIEQIQNC